jgi:hypothetical protein
MSTKHTNRRVAVLLAGLIGIGAGFLAGPTAAGADIDDFCGDPVDGCQDPFDGPDDFCGDAVNGCQEPEPDPEGDPELPEAQPEPEADDDLPPAEVDDVVVADPTFTG